jgi:CubicO group peptidase (beta-lactamase class C family)
MLMLRRRLIVVLGLLASTSLSVAQNPAPTPKSLDDFDAIVGKAMADSKIPGLSVAVVRDGKVIYAKGFGLRDVENRLPVTTETLFAIGSVSKSFTSLIFGTLNDEGKAEWDKPVRSYLPTFQIDDPIATDHATPRDLLSHRTGLPGHDLIWYSSNFSREELFNRLKYLKSNKEFRSGYEYCNLMIMTMGYLEGRVANSSWEELVRTRVFDPLGMQKSNFSVNDSQKSPDFAQPYSLKKDVVAKVPFKNIDAIGPAGSINSSISDMSHYLIFQLGDGAYNGKRIVSENNLKLVHTGQTAVTGLPEFFTQNGLGPMAYAMGWVDTTFRGHHMVWHNGGIDGFHSLLTMLPEDKMGVVILSNLDDNRALEPIAYSAFDRLLALSLEPWLDRYQALGDKAKKAADEAKKSQVSSAKAGTQLSHPLSDFAGDYINPGYGTVKIAQTGEVLTISLNQLGPYPFGRVHYDIFEVPKSSDSIAAGTKGQFYTNWNGDIDRLALPLEATLPEDIVFTRAPEKVSKDTLLTLVGDYDLGGNTLHVGLAGDSLQLAIAGQPNYELIPTRGLVFNCKGLNGFSVEFKKDAAGKISEMLVSQPDGASVAKKKP